MQEKPYILNIETTTEVCSVALSYGRKTLDYREVTEKNSHSRILSCLIDDLIKANCDYRDLNAVCVSKGPGSYTGLRIGVSTAKGLCYGLGIPLMAVDTLQILYVASHRQYRDYGCVAMLDARRMEVYCEIFSPSGEVIKGVSADIIEEGIYKEYLGKEKFVFCGTGAEKAYQIAGNNNTLLDLNINLNARFMTQLSYQKYQTKSFEDVAYFEPHYLKDFLGRESSVKGLY